jgi:hypothetical protein
MIPARDSLLTRMKSFEREQNQQHRKSEPIRGPADDKAAAGGPIR